MVYNFNLLTISLFFYQKPIPQQEKQLKAKAFFCSFKSVPFDVVGCVKHTHVDRTELLNLQHNQLTQWNLNAVENRAIAHYCSCMCGVCIDVHNKFFLFQKKKTQQPCPTLPGNRHSQ